MDRPYPVVLGFLTLSLAATGCGNGENPGTIRTSGYVEATEVRISAKIGGTLEWFPLDEGDPVETGAEVARIDTVDLALQLDAIRAERDQADAELRLRRRGYREEDVAAARADLERVEIERAAAQLDLERFQGLWETGSGTAKTRDDALARRDAAAKAAEAARQRLRKLEAGFREEEIAASTARLAAAEARIAIIEQQIRDATVTSPTGGVVTETLVEPGEIVPAGSILAVITDLSDAWLTAYVPEPDLGRIRIGQKAEVITDGGEARTGWISWISPRAEFTPKNVQTREERVKLVYRIKVRIPNEDGLFKPGMPAEARIPDA